MQLNRLLILVMLAALPLMAQTTPKTPAPPAAASKSAAQAVPAKAAAPAAPGGTIKYLCYSTDPARPAVYFSDIFDVPDTGSVADNFVAFQQIKIGFEKYLLEKYKYVSSADEWADCAYKAVGGDKPEAVAQVVEAKKQSVAAEAAAAKKQVVATGWKYTGTDKTAAASNTPASGGSSGKTTDAQANAASSDPLIVWHLESTKDDLTGAVSTPQPTATKYYLDNGIYVSISASCASNGVGVFFLASAGDKDPVPQYAWYTEQSDDNGDQVADVRIVVDGGTVHVAQGWPEKEGHTLYTNNLGLLFYEPNIVARSARQQEESTSTGIGALDGLIAPMVRQEAQANAQDWADNSAGPMSNLLNARSVRVELPLTNENIKPILDLNPQDKVLHQFVADCTAKFAGGRR